MLADFFVFPLPLIFVVSLMGFLGSSAVGFRFGKRSSNGRSGSGISVLADAFLVLPAFMIGFTFLVSMEHFDARRFAISREVINVTSAARRAYALPSPYGEESLGLVSEYMQLCLEIERQVPTRENLAASLERSKALQAKLWQQVAAMQAINPENISSDFYVIAMIELFANQEERWLAISDHIPGMVILSLYGVSIIVFGFSGYAAGLKNRYQRISVAMLCLILGTILIVIQVLDTSGGVCECKQQPLLDNATELSVAPDFCPCPLIGRSPGVESSADDGLVPKDGGLDEASSIVT